MKQQKTSNEDPLREVTKLRTQLEKYEKVTKKREEEDLSLRQRYRRLLKQLAELKRAQQQVIQRERLHALGQMASGIVHDFNNSLTPILGASDFLLMNPEMLDNKDEAKTLIESIRTAARDARNVVHRLREFYRPDEDAVTESVDINPVIEQVILLTHPKWKEQTHAGGQSIEIKLDLKRIPTVRASESRLREVLTNLILNSVDAMPRGGTITITTDIEGDHVVVKVSDTGKGMNEEICQRCFEPFFSTKGKNGTGLGLSMAYGIIQKWGGTIIAESEINKGTTIIIHLPAENIPPVRNREVATDPDAVAPLIILVADDNPPSRDIVSRHLRANGHAVDTATNGHETVAMCLAKKYDLLVLDRVLADMDGLTIAATMSHEHPEFRIILLTGYNDPSEDTSRLPDGVDFLLEKPVTQSDLRWAIGNVLRKKPFQS
jgi:signal transduction histidine kinase/ActR/RegA family two-component response regulator